MTILAFAGDAMLARGISAQQNIPLWRDLEDALHDVDVFAFNLDPDQNILVIVDLERY